MRYTVYQSNPWQDQYEELELNERLSLRVFFVRSGASESQASCSQDAICVCVDSATDAVAFCVCDGVGSSFAGHIAAYYLAQRLPYVLLEQRDSPSAEDEAVRESLQGWARDAVPEVAAVALPPGTTAFVRDVLETLRLERSSETVFLAGCVRWTEVGGSHAHESPHIEARIYAMGNVRGVIICNPPLGDRSTRLAINHDGSDKNRWATSFGCQGALTIERFGLPAGAHVRIYTDGVGALGDITRFAPDATLLRRAMDIRVATDTDDMAILDLWIADQPHVMQVGPGENRNMHETT